MGHPSHLVLFFSETQWKNRMKQQKSFWFLLARLRQDSIFIFFKEVLKTLEGGGGEHRISVKSVKLFRMSQGRYPKIFVPVGLA